MDTMIMTAKKAACITAEKRLNQQKILYETVANSIIDAATKGNCFCTIDRKLPEDLVQHLIPRGYTVTHHDGSSFKGYTIITWPDA